MPRFQDEWIIDRVLFDYSCGGACACCGIGYNMFLPNGTQDLIQSITDLESDAIENEKQLLINHPWPEPLRDQVWVDRVKIRQLLKREMISIHLIFWKQYEESFINWYYHTVSPNTIQRLLQVSRQEISEFITRYYNIHSAYGVVLDIVMEQVANFTLTGYPPDAPSLVLASSSNSSISPELDFEQALIFDRRGGFTLRGFIKDEQIVQGKPGGGDASGGDQQQQQQQPLNEDVLNIWLKRMQSLAGPKLLDRGPSRRSRNGYDDNGGGDADEDEDANEVDDDGADDGDHVISSKSSSTTTTGPSFKSDRRIVRLLIARYWAKIFQDKFLSSLSSTATATATTTTTLVTTTESS